MASRLTQITARKPAWLRVPAPGGPNYLTLKQLMRELKLHTVCEAAHCPNVGECWEHKAATFMILGDVCTRNCAYCAVAHGTPAPLDTDEPMRLAEAVQRMGLAHVVITSVDRDDLPNGGAAILAAGIPQQPSPCAITSPRLPHPPPSRAFTRPPRSPSCGPSACKWAPVTSKPGRWCARATTRGSRSSARPPPFSRSQ